MKAREANIPGIVTDQVHTIISYEFSDLKYARTGSGIEVGDCSYLSGNRPSFGDLGLDYLRLLDLGSKKTYSRSVGSSGGGLL